MAEIVGAFCLPHDPFITAYTERAEPGQASRIFAAFEHIRKEITARRADTAIIIGDDHYALFGPACQPQLLIATGDLEGPLEPWLRIERRPVANNTPLAEHLLRFGLDEGFDFAVAKSLVLDHSIMVPVHLAVPNDVLTVPIYIASGVEPLISWKRCMQLGQMLRRAIHAWPQDQRVVIFGTGGISHWVGTAEMGQVNPEFDREMLRLVEQGDIEGMAALSDETIMREGGNGAFELRNWMVAMAAMPGCRGKILAYEPMEAWVTGLGLAELIREEAEP
jgi:protocatechuate 4,5-dioxygenase beta chain